MTVPAPRGIERQLRVGLVCPYALDVPGGVQTHVLDLARALRRLGHTVNVLAPADADAPLPEFVTAGGRGHGVRYNGSVARLTFGLVAYARVRRWLGEHDFDVLHLHEPVAPSLSLLALAVAEGPIVATFHTATLRSRTLSAVGGVLRPLLEKVTARIAVSPMARRVQVEHLGGDAVEIPNGVDVPLFAEGPRLPDYPAAGSVGSVGSAGSAGSEVVGFVGRFDEPRKGMPVLLAALRQLAAQRPELRLLVVGRGDGAGLRRAAGIGLADRLDVLGAVDDATKAAALRSMDVYCAPNLGQESFGMVLTEAMAAGTPVLASDLDAFRMVLGPDGGLLVPRGDPPALAAALQELLDDRDRRELLAVSGRHRAARYDWPVVAGEVIRVYQAAIAADPRRLAAGAPPPPLGAGRIPRSTARRARR